MAPQTVTFHDAILKVYEATRTEFARRATDPVFQKYVVPPATYPNVGFTIFYNPPILNPPLLIIGLNPANFGPGASPKEEPNGEMLSCKPPIVNSYIDHNHYFAIALQNGFAKHQSLFKATLGMNLWFFQASAGAANAPEELCSFCAERTKELIAIVKPEAILCLSSDAFRYLTNDAQGRPTKVVGAKKARYADVNGTRIWYSYHPTASRREIRDIGVADLPIVVDAIAQAK